MPIQVLPANLIDQIAAGEVIERPASVVKELIENAFDASATRIEIDVERAGLGLIRVRDDGSGMDAADLSLAIERHATSKIATLDDLEGIASFGFRGEALPSIASVARVRLVSRQREAAQANELSVEGGERSDLKPAAHPVGSSVEVRDLFYNVPARRKFVRSEGTEFAHILRQVERLALSEPKVALRLKHNGREVLDLPAAVSSEQIEMRLDRIVGPQFRSRAIAIEQIAGPMQLTGWLGLPTASRAQADMQYWFVNARAVRDRLLGNAVRLGYRDVLYHGRHAAYVLYLTLDPRLVDVNAHPTKLELRFRDTRAVHDGVFRCIERALAVTRPAQAIPSATALPSPPALAVSTAPTAMPLRLYAGVSATAAFQSYAAAPATARIAELQPGRELERPLGTAIAQLHGLYILAQTPEGMIVVDTHAAHERVLYEQLKSQYDGSTPASQSLLEPLTVTAAEHEVEALLLAGAQFERVGFELERYTPHSLVVRRVPALLMRSDIVAMLAQLGRELTGEAGSHHLDAAAHRILGSIACRSAIRGQRTMSLGEMDALLRQMEQTDRASQCNHGRPTWLRLTLREIDQLFLRGR
ncbi:MAG TPA: DNA mismatch repair endonuclease MutL [Steroidobacteraceae bacterium]|jgi:DNA mismatch repair protein MutL|nr:DNA mismatch repair endonuclease MutL [Steroidobacteraceae bacterium]